jgi:hypothetical protein
VRHGLNSTTLYGGFETLPMAAEAGMTRAPCLALNCQLRG